MQNIITLLQLFFLFKFIYLYPLLFFHFNAYIYTYKTNTRPEEKYRKREKNKKFYKSVFLHTWWITLYFTRENKFSRGQIYILDAFSTSMISSTNFHPLFSLISPITSKERLREREKPCFSKTNRKYGERKKGEEKNRARLNRNI